MKLYRRLLSYVRPYWRVFIVAVFGMVLVASTDVLMLRVVEPLLRTLQTPDQDYLFLDGRYQWNSQTDGQVTVYVCENFACKAPLVGAEAVEKHFA